MSEQCEDGGPVINTAVHLWPKTQSPDAEYLAVWGVGDDAIGIEVGGHVVSKTIRAWFELQADLLKKEEEIARLVLAADDAHLSRIAAEEERELLRKERDQLKSCEVVMRTALREIAAYQGAYASDKNPTIRAIKRIANDAMSLPPPTAGGTK